MEESFLYPKRASDPPCPVVQQQALSKEDQQKYVQWIEQILELDWRTSKDERLYCGCCDMNNHPRFTCKHFYKHRKEAAPHRCTLCSGVASMLNFVVQEHSAMVDAESQIGLELNTSLPSKKLVNQAFDGDKSKHSLQHLQLKL